MAPTGYSWLSNQQPAGRKKFIFKKMNYNSHHYSTCMSDSLMLTWSIKYYKHETSLRKKCCTYSLTYVVPTFFTSKKHFRGNRVQQFQHVCTLLVVNENIFFLNFFFWKWRVLCYREGRGFQKSYSFSSFGPTRLNVYPTNLCSLSESYCRNFIR